MPPRLPDNPKQIVFSGGGLRCFWQGGQISELGRHMTIAPQRATGVSGGAPADKIDFTDPRKLRDTWAQGERDARRLLDPEAET